MFVEVDPGEGKPLEEGERIQVTNTLPDIDPDEFLAVLDSDTRDYLKLLITGAGKGLDGRGTDLREALRRLGPLHRDLARVSTAVAERRHNLRRLINRYGKLTTALGDKDEDIVRLVRASNATSAPSPPRTTTLPPRSSACPGRSARRSRPSRRWRCSPSAWARPSRRCARRSASSTRPTRPFAPSPRRPPRAA